MGCRQSAQRDVAETSQSRSKSPIYIPPLKQIANFRPKAVQPYNLVIFVIGGPGSGKGTQCQQIVDEYGFVHFSVGQMLRDEVNQNSEIGNQAKIAMEEGKLVPVEITLKMIQNAMDVSQNKRFLIDGCPRAVAHAKAFEEKVQFCLNSISYIPLHTATDIYLNIMICKPDMVIYLECTSEVMEKRLLQRGETSGRIDDNVETIKKRFKTFEEETLPVIQYYDRPGMDILVRRHTLVRQVQPHRATPAAGRVNSALPINEVFSGIANSFKEMFSFELASILVHKKHDCNKTTIVFILGGPGSGKGTQCSRLARDFGFTHVSTGDLLRNEVKSGTEIGKEVENIMKEGKLVTVGITMTLLQKAMSSATCKHFLVDGFPRSLEQAKEFEEKIGKPYLVLYLKCSLETMEKRLIERGKTSGRSDDNIESIRQRFEEFENESKPVVEYYESSVREISAENDVDTIYKEVKNTLLSTVEMPL
eukprot:Gb_09605 [translate_table: standard]